MKASDHLPRDAVFVDRDAERSSFRQLLSAAPLPIVIVTGEAGIGKTALLQSFRVLLKAADYDCVHADTAASAGTVPATLARLTAGGKYKQTSALLKKLFEIWNAVSAASDEGASRVADAASDIPASAAGDFVEKALPDGSGLFIKPLVESAVGQAVRFGLGPLLRRGMPAKDVQFAIDPIHQLTSAFINDVKQLTQRHRLTVMLDSVERAPMVLDWFANVVLGREDIPTDRLLFVLAGRLSADMFAHSHGHVYASFPLKPLADGSTMALLGNLGVNDAGAANQILREAGGIPWLIEAMASVFTNAPAAFHQGAWRKTKSQFAVSLTEHLPPSVRHLLAAASCLREFDTASLSALIDEPVDATDLNALTRLSYVDMIDDRHWRVADPVRTAIEEVTSASSPALTASYHERAEIYYSSLLLTVDVDRRPATVAAIAYHIFRHRPVDLLRRMDALLSHALSPLNKDMISALLAETEAAAQRGECSLAWHSVYVARAQVTLGNWDRAATTVRQVLADTTTNTPTSVIAAAHEQLGWIALHQGSLEAARREFERAYESFDSAGDSESVVRMLNHLGRISRRLGELSVAEEYHRNVLTRAQVPRDRVAALRCLSRLCRDQGDWKRAIEYGQESLGLAEEHHYRNDSGLMRIRLAELHSLRGDWARARTYYQTGNAALRASGNELAHASASLVAGRIAAWNDDADAAYSYYVHALRLFRHLGATVGVALANFGLGEAAYFQSNLRGAHQYVADAVEALGEDDWLAARLTLLQAELLIASGEPERAGATLTGDILVTTPNKYVATARDVLSALLRLKSGPASDLPSLRPDAEAGGYTDLQARIDVFVAAQSLLNSPAGNSEAFRKASAAAAAISPALCRTTSALVDQPPEACGRRRAGREKKRRIALPVDEDGMIRLDDARRTIPATQERVTIFLHHALTAERRDGIVQGRLDPDLLPESRTDAALAAQRILQVLSSNGTPLRNLSIFTSPLRRAYQTALAVADVLQQHSGQSLSVTVRHAFNNLGLGSWEGGARASLHGDAIWQQFREGRNWLAQPPGGCVDASTPETLVEAVNRGINAIHECLQECDTAIFVGHKMTVMVPGALYFAMDRLADADGSLNWRRTPGGEGDFVVYGMP